MAASTESVGSPSGSTTAATQSRMNLNNLFSAAVHIIFYGFVSFIVPYIIETRWRFVTWLASMGFFYLMTIPVSWFTDRNFSKIPQNKRDECENRLNSLIFNISTSIPAYLGYNGILPGQPPFEKLVGGHTDFLDIFAAWSIGYIIYDFSTLYKTYGKGSAQIQLHHCAEAAIIYLYTVHPLGAYYLVGGGLMQLSSGVLHVQRIMALSGYAKVNMFTRFWTWFLILTWFHARLLAFPYIMYTCYITTPMSPLHAFILFVGTALTVMNTNWMYKIVRMKSLAF